jgi:hypothetical protein
MKFITNYTWICLLPLLTAVTACKKILPTLYNGEDAVSFTISSTSADNSYTLSSFDFPDGTDTLKVGILFTLYGRVSEQVRPIKLITDTASRFIAGKDAVFSADTVNMPGNKTYNWLYIKLVAPPETDDTLRVISFKMQDNEYFKTDVLSKAQKTGKIIFGSFYYKPRGWDNEIITRLWGDYSEAKVKAIVTANATNALVLTTLQQFYVIEDTVNTLSTKTFYSLLNIYQSYFSSYFYNFLQDMTAKTQQYLADQKANGTPVLDENGQEVQLN